MSKRHHTVIFVPHAHAKLRKWQVSNLQIGLTAGAFVLLTFVAAFCLVSYFTTPAKPAEVARLRQENEKLRQVNQGFETSLRELQEKLGSYEDRTRQLAIVAGLESLGDGADAGIGGGEPVDELGMGGPVDLTDPSALPDLGDMQHRAGELAGTLDAVEEKLADRLQWLSAIPAISPVKGILTSGFGYRADPLTHGRGLHQGIDIAAAPGQPVKATADGIVIRAGVVGGLGNAVYVSHGYGVTTRYGHLSRVDVRPGERVKRGDVVGRVGNTGRSTGPHLHYEVRLDGEPVNPLAYIFDDGAAPF